MNTNEMTEFEIHLRSWVPRRPSKGLKHRLFPRPHAVRQGAGATPLLSPFTVSWLTASAAALLILALIHHPRPAPSTAQHPPAIVAMALSNQAAVAALSTASSNEQCLTPTQGLTLTNLRALTSSFSPRSLTTTTN